MMRSQKTAPDLLDKGVHFNVGDLELKIRPNHKGGVVFKPVHPGQVPNTVAGKKAFAHAAKQAEEGLQSPEFREWIRGHAERGAQLAEGKGNAKVLEFRLLLKSLKNFD
jgi:hypothetical protein